MTTRSRRAPVGISVLESKPPASIPPGIAPFLPSTSSSSGLPTRARPSPEVRAVAPPPPAPASPPPQHDDAVSADDGDSEVIATWVLPGTATTVFVMVRDVGVMDTGVTIAVVAGVVVVVGDVVAVVAVVTMAVVTVVVAVTTIVGDAWAAAC